jgi:hypothetical protein
MRQVRSDWLSRFAKAWKREAERIADQAGRDGLPVVAIHADLFSGVLNLPHRWFSKMTELDHIPVRFVAINAKGGIPWEVADV